MNHSKLTDAVIALVTALALVGLADSLYLLAESSGNDVAVCNVLNECSVVLNSRWATLFGMPTSLFGAVYYALLLLAANWFWWRRSDVVLDVLLGIATVGFLITSWLVYLQAVVLSAFCEFCLVSAATTTLIWFGILWLRFGTQTQNTQT